MDKKYNFDREDAIAILTVMHEHEDDLTESINIIKENLEDKVHDLSAIIEEFRDCIDPHGIPECFLTYDFSIDSNDVITERVTINGINYKNKKDVWDTKIEVVEPEGNNHPHFHLTYKNNKYKTAIKLNENKYFLHGMYNKKLNKDELKKLIYILKSPYKNMSMFTVWQILCMQWNTDEKHTPISFDIKDMPDYSSMTESV